MPNRRASCNCGQLQVVCEGEPVRISMCQRRTGAVLSNQARGAEVKSDAVAGSTVYWELEGFPDVVAVAVGAFADPSFPAPQHSVYERHRHCWVKLPADMPIQHLD
jgi:hypothetical protein